MAPSIALCRLGPWNNSRHPGVGFSVAEGVQGEPQSKDIRAERELSFSSGLSLRMIAQIFQKCGQKVRSAIIVVRDAVKLSMARGTYAPFRASDAVPCTWVQCYR